DEPQDLEFARRDVRSQPSMRWSKLAQQRRQISWGSDRVILVGRKDGIDKLVDPVLLLDEARTSGRYRADESLIVGAGREHDHLDRGHQRLDLPGRLRAVAVG